jgi:hypothetical protein
MLFWCYVMLRDTLLVLRDALLVMCVAVWTGRTSEQLQR